MAGRTWRPVLAFVLVLGIGAPASADAPGSDRIDDARAAVSSRPGDPELRLTLTVLLIEQLRPEDALRELDLLEALAPEDERTLYWRARALLDLGRAAEAEDVLRDAGDRLALGLRGRLREERGDRAGAASDYAAASLWAPTIELDLALARVLERDGRIEDASVALEGGVRRTGAAVLRVRALELARRMGRYDIALSHADSLIGSSPHSTRWRVLRASVLRDMGREGDASRELRAALTAADRMVRLRGSALSLQERARVRLNLGLLASAQADLELALRLSPSLTDARRLLASASARAGR